MCLLPGFGCESEEKKTAFSAGMSGAVKLSQCVGVSIDGILRDTGDGDFDDFDDFDDLDSYLYPDALQWFEEGILGDGSLTSTDSAAREAMTAKLSCMGSSRDCEAVLACAGLSAESCDSDSVPACDGDTATTCVHLGYGAATMDWGRKRTIDCSRDVHGNTECGLITIEQVDDWNDETSTYDYQERTIGNFCHAGACKEGADTCDGDVLVSCVTTWLKEDYESNAGPEAKLLKERRFNCAKYGMICDESFSGATCRQPDAQMTCTTDYCDGSTLIACSGGVPSYAVDCGSFHSDFECVDRGGEGGSDCAVTTPKRVCAAESECINEKRLGVCVGGVWVSGNCGSFQSGVCSAQLGDVYCVGPGMIGVPEEPGIIIEGDATSSRGECGSSEWLCFTGECISKSVMCDGAPDCEYGEDEFDCSGDGGPTPDAWGGEGDGS